MYFSLTTQSAAGRSLFTCMHCNVRSVLLVFAFAVFCTGLQGQVIEERFGKNRVQYHDDFDNWFRYESDNFLTFWYGKSRNVAHAAIEFAELDFKEIHGVLEHRINDRIELIVYTDPTDMKQTNIGLGEFFMPEEGSTFRVFENKIFVCFTGDHNELRRQVREGIAEVYINALLFGSIGVAYGDGDAPVRLLITGTMLFHLIWQVTLAGSLGFLEEVWSRNVLNLIATPLTEREVLASLGLVGLARTVVTVVLVGGVGLGFYAVAPESAGWVLVPGVLVLLAFGWAVTLMVVGLTLQYGDSAEVFSWGTLVLLMPLSGVFYPTESLPAVLEPVARAIPLTQVFDAAREGLETGRVAWGRLAIGAAGSAVSLAAATWFIDRQLRRFRREGWVTRFT